MRLLATHAFCHITFFVYFQRFRVWKNWEATESKLFEVLRLFEHFSKHFVCSEHNSHKAVLKSVNENLSLKLETTLLSLGSIGLMELKIMAFVKSVSIPIPFAIPIPMPRFQCRGLQMALLHKVVKKYKIIVSWRWLGECFWITPHNFCICK